MRIPAISLENVTQQFGSYRAVNDLNMQISEGEIFGFLGHNGAGKTTTIHILTTLSKPTSGTGNVFGIDLIENPADVRKVIGYVPENVRLYGTLTARENLIFFAGLSKISNPQARVLEVLKFLKIEYLADKRVGHLSKGMRQRVGLAQAILHQPKILFLDEPASGLDPMGIKLLRDFIGELNREFGTTIFMNTHLISEISKTCTSIGVLSNGNLIFQGPVSAVKNRFGHDGALEELYLNVQATQPSIENEY